jgi:DNA-binding LytR/AlgR family response regulator
MKQTYVIISDNRDEIAETKAVMAAFPTFSFVGSAMDYDEAVDCILDKKPTLVFLEIEPENKGSDLGLPLINELHRYLQTVPQIIVTAKSTEKAYSALKYEVLDFLVSPFRTFEVRKSILRFQKRFVLEESPENEIIAPLVMFPEEIIGEHVEQDIPVEPEIIPDADIAKAFVEKPEATVEKPLIICVKSYGDYRFIEAKDICYLQADNNSTDIHLYNGEMITGFKTLKHFESVLSSPFVRIHNSYIVNIDYVSRIHTGNSVCYIKNTSIKLPFSKSYKENVDAIINSIANGNYIEI